LRGGAFLDRELRITLITPYDGIVTPLLAATIRSMVNDADCPPSDQAAAY